MHIPFDQRHGTIWYNGELISWQDGKIHIMTHGLHYASAAFEGERAYNGKVFKLKEHTLRLFNSAKLIGLKIPYTVEEIIKGTEAVLKAQELLDGYLRPIVWSGSEKMTISAPENKIHTAIIAWSWPSDYQSNKDKAIRMCFAKWIKADPRSVPYQSKASGLYVTCILSKQDAEAKGYDDALFLDYRGYIAEGTTSNFFLVKNNILYTPIADCFLDGITRQTVIEIAKSLNIEVVEKHMLPAELANADEAFLTGTAAEITPIKAIEQYEFKDRNLTTQIIEAYHQLVRAS
jgi:branched-chain amino acid aminotransferase